MTFPRFFTHPIPIFSLVPFSSPPLLPLLLGSAKKRQDVTAAAIRRHMQSLAAWSALEAASKESEDVDSVRLTVFPSTSVQNRDS